MPPATRSFLAIAGGMAVAVIVVSLCDAASAALHPVPPNFDFRDMAQVNAHVASAPMSAMLVMVAGWIIGPFLGGLLASRVARIWRARHALVICGLMLAATISNLMGFVHPSWMWAVALLGIPGAGWLAARLTPADAAPGAR